MNIGVVQAALAYVAWGLFPLYFHQVATVSAMEIVLHRTVWSLVFVLGVLAAMRRFGALAPVLRQPRQLGLFMLSALLLSGNWLVYVWAVNNGHVIDASLGYFINPLVYVLLGYAFLHERLRPMQWAAIALAGLGVLWLTWQGGQLPWIALLLAGSFGLYGLMRKTASLGALEGLALETLLLAPLAVPALAVWTLQGSSTLAHADAPTVGWLLLAGPITAVPLLLFAAGARRITLATLGLLQYIGPTLQFAIGLWVFHEPFQANRLLGFILIWAALALYSAEGLWVARQRAVAAA
ncbi:EamA family transporter RarD [Azohydromonas caseinilytica]|uniref:EamA family transporter RarD n=1 Tax=Azohydromonas caseinilytica TaxID=2728836 RepID=A0A848FB46_9BURK|nr:EamA family transporter RarD [Azohydromonas caseinilytica]NML16518.1 EamA family transporter RarD [Azohydromonas caseinilytica]